MWLIHILKLEIRTISGIQGRAINGIWKMVIHAIQKTAEMIQLYGEIFFSLSVLLHYHMGTMKARQMGTQQQKCTTDIWYRNKVCRENFSSISIWERLLLIWVKSISPLNYIHTSICCNSIIVQCWDILWTTCTPIWMRLTQFHENLIWK